MKHTMDFKNKRIRFLFPVFASAILFAVSAAVMLLWNAIIPDISPLNPISYWQAMGLLVLCRILFGSLRFANARHHPRAIHGIREKFMNLNPEEQKAFREEWKTRCHSRKSD